MILLLTGRARLRALVRGPRVVPRGGRGGGGRAALHFQAPGGAGASFGNCAVGRSVGRLVGWLVGDGASRASEVRLAVPRCLVITITLRLSATITNYLLPLTTIDHRQSPTAHQNFTHQNLSAIRGPHILSAVPPMAPVQGKKPQAPGHHDRRVSAAVPRGRRRRNDGLRAPARVRLLSYRQHPSPSITIHRWIAWRSSLAPLSRSTKTSTSQSSKTNRYITAHVVPRYERPLEDESEYSSIGSNPFTDPDHRLLGLCAAFLPYYCDDDGSFLAVIDRIAAAGQRTNPQEPQEPQGQQPPPGQRLHFSAVDFAVGRAVDALSNDVRSDAATAQYLRRLASLKSHVKGLRLSTRIRLQGVLYSFAQPGGPRYASKGVNRLAFRTLDELFPHGKRTRRAINFGFRGLFVFSKLTGAVYYACVVRFFSASSTGSRQHAHSSIRRFIPAPGTSARGSFSSPCFERSSRRSDARPRGGDPGRRRCLAGAASVGSEGAMVQRRTGDRRTRGWLTSGWLIG